MRLCGCFTRGFAALHPGCGLGGRNSWLPALGPAAAAWAESGGQVRRGPPERLSAHAGDLRPDLRAVGANVPLGQVIPRVREGSIHFVIYVHFQ